MRVATIAEVPVRRIVHGTLTVATRGESFTDLTPAVTVWLGEIGGGEGLVSAFVTHTTASLTVQENADPDVRHDLLQTLSRLAPRNASYRHEVEGPDDMPAHIRTMLSDTAVILPVRGGHLAVGTWQALYLVEHRDGPRDRRIVLTYLGD
jgi:secondary thiamine-phosphate synthase enzyme